MKKAPKNKILKEELSSLISKYSQSNVLEELAKTHYNNPIQKINTKVITDNQFVSKVTFSRSKISHFIENYQRNILLEPLVVRARDDKYEVIIGRKRLAAAKSAQISEIPVIVMNYNDEETLLILLAKARDSHDSNTLELAYIFTALATKCGYSHESLAKLAFLSRAQVTNIIRILKLDPTVLKALNNDLISFGHARSLIGLSAEDTEKYLSFITNNKISVRELEALIRRKDAIVLEKDVIIKQKNKVTIVFEDETSADEFIEKYRTK